MLALALLAGAAGASYLLHRALAVIATLPRSNNDFIFL